MQFGTNDGCHCNCGAWDPDCDSATSVAVDCPDVTDICIPGPKCVARHVVMAHRKAIETATHDDTFSRSFVPRFGLYNEPVTNVPKTWTCPSVYYGGHDGCDCECGAWDPDCLDDAQAVHNCPTSTFHRCAKPTGRCELKSKVELAKALSNGNVEVEH